MLAFLKDHPFAVEAFFDSSLVLTFAVPQQELAALIPECLALDTFQDRWAFVAVALVQTRGLRPRGFPAFLGNDFFLIGYRIFVRYTTAAGKRLRGLYILKSETDQKKMEWFGNLFTHYRYSTIDVALDQTAAHLEITSRKAGLHLVVAQPGAEAALPPHSPFASWQEARRFAGPLPFTFSYDAPNKSVLLIEGVRQNWQPQPVVVKEYQVGFLQTLPLSAPILANAFRITNIPYAWQKGRKELWQG